MERTRWTDRKFTFDIPEGWLPNILERLHGTATRIQELTAQVSEEDAERRPPDKWSVKEHIGHLSDLEDLHEGRIDDFLARREILRAADMTNQKTDKAGHNHKKLKELIDLLRQRRSMLIARLEQLDDDAQLYRSLHPRLQLMMRPVDMAFFTAEHDDHHLATIRELLNKMSK